MFSSEVKALQSANKQLKFFNVDRNRKARRRTRKNKSCRARNNCNSVREFYWCNKLRNKRWNDFKRVYLRILHYTHDQKMILLY